MAEFTSESGADSPRRYDAVCIPSTELTSSVEMQPLYTSENTTVAYQLNWSVALFGTGEFPSSDVWMEDLKMATESDGVRILEHHEAAANVSLFLVSTKPFVSPSQIVRSVKGRWQYLMREVTPKAFRRNYSISSVGETKSDVLERYVARQPQNHPMADADVQQRIEALQFHDASVNLGADRISSHGRFIHSLHVVLENESGWNEIRNDVLIRSRRMIIDSAAKHLWGLARIGIVSNHVHVLLTADVTESPESVALSLMNNLAYVQGMRPVLRFSYYVGTFGEYDRAAVRRKLRT